ncbi:hypothetical protein J6590_016031 [Homalodisca vitripennis]|nr:hypothetical protein J6590_016031 [Homalodisca vitripennis]
MEELSGGSTSSPDQSPTITTANIIQISYSRIPLHYTDWAVASRRFPFACCYGFLRISNKWVKAEIKKKRGSARGIGRVTGE